MTIQCKTLADFPPIGMTSETYHAMDTDLYYKWNAATLTYGIKFMGTMPVPQNGAVFQGFKPPTTSQAVVNHA